MQPSFSLLEDVIERLILSIVESAQKLPRVEHVLFDNLHGLDMCIPAMEVEDEVVQATKARALKLISANYPGPEKYVQSADCVVVVGVVVAVIFDIIVSSCTIIIQPPLMLCLMWLWLTDVSSKKEIFFLAMVMNF